MRPMVADTPGRHASGWTAGAEQGQALLLRFEAWVHMQGSVSAIAWVALGAALGGVARYFLAGFIGQLVGERFPWGTVIVNVSGAFAIGMLAAAAAGNDISPTSAVWPFAVVGFLGSYTTVSAFSLQTLVLFQDGRILQAAGNVVLSVGLCLAAVALGFAASTAWGGYAP